jgi:hypothetical protein
MAGVNWDRHCKRWLARVYEPSKDGAKGKEHKVGYYDDEHEAGRELSMKALVSAQSICATYQLEMFTYLRFHFQDVYCLDLEREL